MTTPTKINFRSPPVIEVVCGLQFTPLERFTSVHFGAFHNEIVDEYGDIEERAPIAEIFENKEITRVDSIEIQEVPPLRRVFYVDKKSNFLLQLQPSRFLANWRKISDTDEYPRFERVYDRFVAGWRRFSAYAERARLGPPEGNQYELTYINHVLAREGVIFPDAIPSYLNWVRWPSGVLSTPNQAAVRLRFPMGTGALHVNVQHGTRDRDGVAVVLINLTARGPARPDFSDLETWFWSTHEFVLAAFDGLITDTARKEWGRE